MLKKFKTVVDTKFDCKLNPWDHSTKICVKEERRTYLDSATGKIVCCVFLSGLSKQYYQIETGSNQNEVHFAKVSIPTVRSGQDWYEVSVFFFRNKNRTHTNP